jgi:hypothetical protein
VAHAVDLYPVQHLPDAVHNNTLVIAASQAESPNLCEAEGHQSQEHAASVQCDKEGGEKVMGVLDEILADEESLRALAPLMGLTDDKIADILALAKLAAEKERKNTNRLLIIYKMMKKLHPEIYTEVMSDAAKAKEGN